jgi:hypothetical protein
MKRSGLGERVRAVPREDALRGDVRADAHAQARGGVGRRGAARGGAGRRVRRVVGRVVAEVPLTHHAAQHV